MMMENHSTKRLRAGVWPVAAWLLAGAALGARSEVTFSGELQRVTAVSISVRLADGRIIEARDAATHGDLSPATLARLYTIGDRVEITCAPIGGSYAALLGRRLDLELKKLKLIRNPSREERTHALASKAWRQSPNLLQVADEEPAQADGGAADEPKNVPDPEWPARLKQIRSRIVKFVSQMPNFVADEVATRYVSVVNPPDWRLSDTIESETTVKRGAISREHIVVDGKPWESPYRELPGFKWTDAFGSQMTYLFDPKCPTVFEPGGRIAEGGKSLSVVLFSSPPDGCEFYWQSSEQFYPGKTGRILLDESEENIVRLETESRVFPEAFPISSVEKQVSWELVKIGDAAHRLPVSAQITVVLSTGEMRLAKHEYKNHRHFEAASNITFH
jgi:hypothetical protein